jgi:hypothetical protein
MMTNNLSDFITEMKLSTQVEKGQTEFESCIYTQVGCLAESCLKQKEGYY